MTCMQRLLTFAGVLSEALSADGLSLCAAVVLVPVLDRGWLDVVSCPPAVEEAEDDLARLSVVVGAAVFTGCLSDAARELRPRSPATSCRDSHCWDVLPTSLRPDANRFLSPTSLSLERSPGRAGALRSCSADLGPDTVTTKTHNSNPLKHTDDIKF